MSASSIGAPDRVAAQSAPELIATDLDGTFLSPDGTVSHRNATAARATVDAGINFILATGRPIRWLDPVRDLDGLAPMVIASNGAMLFDTATDDVLEIDPVDPLIARDVVADLLAALPGVGFAVEQGWRYGVDDQFVAPELHGESRRRDLPDWVFRAPSNDLIDDAPFVKLLVQHLDYTPDQLLALVQPVVGDRLTVTHSAQGPVGLLEMSAAGISKASRLAQLADHIDIDAGQVAAFGDMPNDLEMLRWAGQPYVMANAHPSLFSLGATVIGSNADDAVGNRIWEWLSLS